MCFFVVFSRGFCLTQKMYNDILNTIKIGETMTQQKKILVLTTTDNMIWQFIVPHMQELQKMGHVVECACARTGFWFDELESKFGFVVHEIKFGRKPWNKENFVVFKKLKKLQEREKYDLIFCHQPVGGVFGRMLGHKFHLPVIYVAHGFHFLKGNSKVKNLIFKTIEKHYSKYTDALVTINDEDYEAAKKFKAKRVYKINGIGVDLTKFKFDKDLDHAKFRAELGLSKDDFVVVSVGELNKNKNTYRILQSIKDIDDSKVKYLVCGQGPLKEDYEKFVADNGLQDRIKLLGYRKDIPKILQISNVFIMPSYREGLSLAMMEAMAKGLPIVASKIRGNTDLLGENEGGIFFNPAETNEFTNAIKDLYKDSKKCKQYGERNLEYVKNFDVEIVKKQFQEIYKQFDL